MKRERYSEEQIIGILKEHDAGLSVAEIVRKHGIWEQRFYAWKSKSAPKFVFTSAEIAA